MNKLIKLILDADRDAEDLVDGIMEQVNVGGAIIDITDIEPEDMVDYDISDEISDLYDGIHTAIKEYIEQVFMRNRRNSNE